MTNKFKSLLTEILSLYEDKKGLIDQESAELIEKQVAVYSVFIEELESKSKRNESIDAKFLDEKLNNFNLLKSVLLDA